MRCTRVGAAGAMHCRALMRAARLRPHTRGYGRSPTPTPSHAPPAGVQGQAVGQDWAGVRPARQHDQRALVLVLLGGSLAVAAAGKAGGHRGPARAAPGAPNVQRDNRRACTLQKSPCLPPFIPPFITAAELPHQAAVQPHPAGLRAGAAGVCVCVWGGGGGGSGGQAWRPPRPGRQQQQTPHPAGCWHPLAPLHSFRLSVPPHSRVHSDSNLANLRRVFTLLSPPRRAAPASPRQPRPPMPQRWQQRQRRWARGQARRRGRAMAQRQGRRRPSASLPSSGGGRRTSQRVQRRQRRRRRALPPSSRQRRGRSGRQQKQS